MYKTARVQRGLDDASDLPPDVLSIPRIPRFLREENPATVGAERCNVSGVRENRNTRVPSLVAAPRGVFEVPKQCLPLPSENAMLPETTNVSVHTPCEELRDLWPQTPIFSDDVFQEVRGVVHWLCAAQSYADAFDVYYLFLHNYVHTTHIRGSWLLSVVFHATCISASPAQDALAEDLRNMLLQWYQRNDVPSRLTNCILRTQKTENRPSWLIQNGRREIFRQITFEPLHLERQYAKCRHTVELLHDAPAVDGPYLRHGPKIKGTTHFQAVADNREHFAQIPMLTELNIELTSGLLSWCREVIRHRLKDLGTLNTILPIDNHEARELVCEMLYCYFMAHWYTDQTTIGQRRWPTESSIKAYATLIPLLRERPPSMPEAMSAMAICVTELWATDTEPIVDLHTSDVLSSVLFSNAKKCHTEDEAFRMQYSQTYHELILAPRSGQLRPPLHDKSRKALRILVKQAIRTGTLNKAVESAPGLWRMAPCASDLGDPVPNSKSLCMDEPLYHIRTASLSHTLLPSAERSRSRSSGAGSSILSAGVSAMSIKAESDWSFSRVTGMPAEVPTAPRHSGVENEDHMDYTTDHEVQSISDTWNSDGSGMLKARPDVDMEALSWEIAT